MISIVTQSEKLLEQARTDLGVFCRYVFDFPLAEFHLEWLRAIREFSEVLIIGPKGHGKTSLAAIATPCFYIGRNPNVRVKIGSCSDEKAKDISFAIGETILNNERYKKVFPNVKPSRTRRWGKQKIYVECSRPLLRDATVEAMGMNTSMAGGRADILIEDDPVDNRNAATPGERRRVKNTYYDIHLNMLAPSNFKHIYIGTIYHEDDLTSELLQKGTYKTLVYAIDENFTPLWPQVWPRERLIQRFKLIGERAFNKAFRNMPASDEEYFFSAQLLDQCRLSSFTLETIRETTKRNLREGRWRTFTGVDLAPGTGKGYSVIFTAAIDEDGIRWPVDIRRARCNSPETARMIIDVFHELKPEVIMVESNMYQQALLDWCGELVKLPLQANFTTASQKHDPRVGVASLQVEFENRLWRLPEFKHQTGCNCAWCAWLHELLAYPHSKYDDTVLAQWHCREAIRRFGTKHAGGGFSLWEF